MARRKIYYDHFSFRKRSVESVLCLFCSVLFCSLLFCYFLFCFVLFCFVFFGCRWIPYKRIIGVLHHFLEIINKKWYLTNNLQRVKVIEATKSVTINMLYSVSVKEPTSNDTECYNKWDYRTRKTTSAALTASHTSYNTRDTNLKDKKRKIPILYLKIIVLAWQRNLEFLNSFSIHYIHGTTKDHVHKASYCSEVPE